MSYSKTKVRNCKNYYILSKTKVCKRCKNMKIKEVAFVCYAVKNLKVARTFYENLLGLKATNTWVKDDTNGMIEYDLANCTFSIGAGAPTFLPGKQGPTVALEVEDFEMAMKELQDAKVKFVMDKYESGVCFMAVIEDPDANQVMIHKRKQK